MLNSILNINQTHIDVLKDQDVDITTILMKFKDHLNQIAAHDEPIWLMNTHAGYQLLQEMVPTLTTLKQYIESLQQNDAHADCRLDMPALFHCLEENNPVTALSHFFQTVYETEKNSSHQLIEHIDHILNISQEHQ